MFEFVDLRQPMVCRCFNVSLVSLALHCWDPGTRLNIKMLSYQYRKSHCGGKTILRPSYLHHTISQTGKMSSSYWIRALTPFETYTLALCALGVAVVTNIFLKRELIYLYSQLLIFLSIPTAIYWHCTPTHTPHPSYPPHFQTQTDAKIIQCQHILPNRHYFIKMKFVIWK